MSGHNLARTLPPTDRDEAPDLLTHAVHDDAPPLTDETDEARLAKLTRYHADATRFLGEALRLLAAGKHQAYAAAMHCCATNLTEAAALSRVLSKSHTARRS